MSPPCLYSLPQAKADEVNLAVNEFAPCDALHGDISQAQREKVRGYMVRGWHPVVCVCDADQV